MHAFDFLQPEREADVLAAIAAGDDSEAMVWGGGTAITLLMKQELIAPQRLVGLYRLPALRGLEVAADGGLAIGAATRIRDLEQSSRLRQVLPCLADTAAGIGNVRVRNAAMLGGHLVHADPAQDLPPLLLTLDAMVHLSSQTGNRAVPLTDFFVDTMQTAIRPDELLTRVTIPAAAVRRRTRYFKYTPRSKDDYGTVGVACSLELAADGQTCNQARIAVGGAGPTARRFPDAEGLLKGQALTPVLVRKAAAVVAEQVEPWDDARGSAAYKRAMSEVWTERMLTALAQGETGAA